MLTDKVASEIRAEMARRRITQAEIAAKLGVSQPWVSRRINGDIPINLDDLEDIAKAIGVNTSDLLGVKGQVTGWIRAPAHHAA